MFQFANPDQFYLFIAVAVTILLFFYGYQASKKSLELFVSSNLLPLMTYKVSRPKQIAKIVLVLISLILLVFVLMRPQGDPEITKVTNRGRDLVFIIDVSRSMLAEDLVPNRLERAKQMVSDVVEVLDGDRIGLLIFAGETIIKSPLTLDYNYFKNILHRISPEDVKLGGTNIGDAIRVVTDRLFYQQDNKFRDIILITDGEDQESFPLEAAKKAAQKGIRIHTVGLGNPDGANIPLRDSESYSLLKYNNKNVTTKLDEATLISIAQITKGVFVPVRTNLADLADLYKKHISTGPKNEKETKDTMVWSELFQFFLGFSVLFIMLETLLGEQKIRFLHPDFYQ